MDRLGFWSLTVLMVALAGCGTEAPESAGAAARPGATTAADRRPSSSAPAPDPAAAPGAPGAPAPSGSDRAAAGESPAYAAGGGGSAAPAAPAPAAAAAPSAPDAAAILTRAERAYEGVRSLEADFVQEVTVPLLDTTQRSRGRIFHRRPDRFLMRFSEPQGDVVVADGEYLWMYYPSTDPKQVLRTRAGANGQGMDLHKEFLADAARRYHATLTGSETVAGQATDVLVLTPRTPSSYRRVRIWVGREDSLVRRFEIVEENESMRLLELRNLKTNGSLADALFRFTPPAGAQIFEQ